MTKLDLFLKVTDYVHFEYDGKKGTLKNLFDFIQMQDLDGLVIDKLDQKELMEMQDNFKFVNHYKGDNFKGEAIEKIYFKYYGKQYHFETRKISFNKYSLKCYEYTV